MFASAIAALTGSPSRTACGSSACVPLHSLGPTPVVVRGGTEVVRRGRLAADVSERDVDLQRFGRAGPDMVAIGHRQRIVEHQQAARPSVVVAGGLGPDDAFARGDDRTRATP